MTVLKFEIDFYQKTNVRKQFDADEMAKDIQLRFSNTIFAIGHSLPYKFEQSPFFKLTVKGAICFLKIITGCRIIDQNYNIWFRAEMHENGKGPKVDAARG